MNKTLKTDHNGPSSLTIDRLVVLMDFSTSMSSMLPPLAYYLANYLNSRSLIVFFLQ